MIQELRADHDIQRWLSFVARRGESERVVKGVRYYRENDGLWYERRVVRDDVPARTPDIVLDADEYVRKTAPAIASQGDISEAMKGLPGVEVTGPDGKTRVDYPRIPLKTSDGKLTKYAKRLIDLHAPATRAGTAAAESIQSQMPRERVVIEGEGEREVTSVNAEAMERAGKARRLRKRRKAKR